MYICVQIDGRQIDRQILMDSISLITLKTLIDMYLMFSYVSEFFFCSLFSSSYVCVLSSIFPARVCPQVSSGPVHWLCTPMCVVRKKQLSGNSVCLGGSVSFSASLWINYVRMHVDMERIDLGSSRSSYEYSEVSCLVAVRGCQGSRS